MVRRGGGGAHKGAVLFVKEQGSYYTRDGGREEGRKEGRKEERVGVGGLVEATPGISRPAAPSGTRHERHFYSDRKSDSREQ